MQSILLDISVWLRIGHVVFMVFWLAGLFMLPRQCIYILDHAPGSAGEAKWADRMGKLRKIILTPSIVVVWLLGLLMAYAFGYFSQGWMHAKITLVVLLSGYHGWLVAQSKKMARGERPLSEKTLRFAGEVPGLILILVVTLVYLRPF
ncbi:CopD family protein [Erythrobacter sp. SCSIO 43205]|uniref:CopD family protein n=1 Tax=Erythrobacter sp. SCSIO 43205 TaxID=2779361 RepID=UPI001CAA36C1|nr:CopD family protein [Erythrobacter sp. SCSIO 43205]UAB78473.1 CopD family protein [Erythrobacter sp. SCSIO 43205]